MESSREPKNVNDPAEKATAEKIETEEEREKKGGPRRQTFVPYVGDKNYFPTYFSGSLTKPNKPGSIAPRTPPSIQEEDTVSMAPPVKKKN